MNKGNTPNISWSTCETFLLITSFCRKVISQTVHISGFFFSLPDYTGTSVCSSIELLLECIDHL